MITDLFFSVLVLILAVIHGVLSAIPISFPPNIQASMTYFGSYIGYAGGYIDISGVFAAFTFLCDFLMAWFAFKAFLMLYHMIFARSVHDSHALPAQNKKQ